jgi:hypothetical protein
MPSSSRDEERAAFQRVLQEQFTRYPLMEVQDLYKLVFQAAFGCEHAVLDAAAARSWLTSEIQGLSEGPPEPVVDTISPDGRIVRVNLRPYLAAGGLRPSLAAGGDAEILLEAFVRTAGEYRGTIEQLQRYWGHAMAFVTAKRFPLSADQLADFFEQMNARGYPSVHHSASYQNAYRPAYRVALRECLH